MSFSIFFFFEYNTSTRRNFKNRRNDRKSRFAWWMGKKIAKLQQFDLLLYSLGEGKRVSYYTKVSFGGKCEEFEISRVSG